MSVQVSPQLPSARAICCLALALSLGACVVRGESYSPWTSGFGVKVAPAFAMGEAEDGPTVHPAFSYSRMGGNSNWVEVGAQVRWPFFFGDQAVWAGGEAMLGRIGGTTGFVGSGLFGVPIGDSRWGPSVFVAAGLSRYSTTGKVVSAGVDLQPWFFNR